MENVIQLSDFREIDPLLRKGDIVKLVKMREFDDGQEYPDPEDLEGLTGVVTGIEIVFGKDSDCPGQAAYANVVVPLEEGWEELGAISIYHLRRVIGPDLHTLRDFGG